MILTALIRCVAALLHGLPDKEGRTCVGPGQRELRQPIRCRIAELHATLPRDRFNAITFDIAKA